MQPYRTAKPHASGCNQCAPTGPGHMLCQNDGCNEIKAQQTQRHATQAEYDAIPEAFKPRDGYATIPVFGCDDCADDGQFEPFCEHTPVASPCPTCGADGGAPCTKKDRITPRAKGWHGARTAPAAETCTHAHRENCEIFTGCQCTGDDPAPTRAPRGMLPGVEPDTSGLKIPIHVAQMILAQAGVPWTTVISARSILTQDNRPAIGAQAYRVEEGHRAYDNHGHPVVQDYVVPLPTGGGALS